MTYFLLVLVVSAILTIAVSADSYHKDSHSYRNYHGNSNNNSDNNSVSKDVSDSYRCPITDSTNIVYSVVDGVGPASNIWVTDFLWWWKQADNTINYVALDANAMRNCALTDYKNLRVYINPGGDAYEQLASLGQEGTNSIKEFVNRKDSPSSYVGFCAGGYIASHDYLWESAYEGPGYYNYAENPPLSIFPHMVEGSIVDINDDQFADQMNSKFRTVNGKTLLFIIVTIEISAKLLLEFIFLVLYI